MEATEADLHCIVRKSGVTNHRTARATETRRYPEDGVTDEIVMDGCSGGAASFAHRLKASVPLNTKSELLVVGASAEVVPDGDEDDGDEEDEGGDGVDFRSDTAAEAAPDFEGKCVFAAV
jgi:hypothetical protein